MTQSWTTIPHIHAMEEIDASRLVELRNRLAALAPEGSAPVTPLVLFVAAAARALRRHPELGATIDTEAGTITVPDHVDVGFAVATKDGLVVPVVRGADRLGLTELAGEVRRLVSRARDGSLTPDELRGGTFTITNYGRLGGQWATPIIRPPEVAIAGFGAIAPRPIVVDGEVVARPTLPVVVGADHRLIDGDLAIAFLSSLAESLTEPLSLLLDTGGAG